VHVIEEKNYIVGMNLRNGVGIENENILLVAMLFLAVLLFLFLSNGPLPFYIKFVSSS